MGEVFIGNSVIEKKNIPYCFTGCLHSNCSTCNQCGFSGVCSSNSATA